MELNTILECFFENIDYLQISKIETGLINHTFIVKYNDTAYILQKINREVFPNLEIIVQNHLIINEILEESDYPYQVTYPQKTLKGNYFDEKEHAWRLVNFIDNATTHLNATNVEMVTKAAEALGKFYHVVNQHPKRKLIKTPLPGFINFENRVQQFQKALKTSPKHLLLKAKTEIEFAKKHLAMLQYWLKMMKNNMLPCRIIHADPKLSNLLFDDKENILAIIDLDTIMPSTILYDFGDMVRSYTNLTREDDTQSQKYFSIDYYEALKQGFIQGIGNLLTPIEYDNIEYAARCVIFVQGLRFLTDFLNGNFYYHTQYEEQNLNRTRNQFQLLKELESHINN